MPFNKRFRYTDFNHFQDDTKPPEGCKPVESPLEMCEESCEDEEDDEEETGNNNL